MKTGRFSTSQFPGSRWSPRSDPPLIHSRRIQCSFRMFSDRHEPVPEQGGRPNVEATSQDSLGGRHCGARECCGRSGRLGSGVGDRRADGAGPGQRRDEQHHLQPRWHGVDHDSERHDRAGNVVCSRQPAVPQRQWRPGVLAVFKAVPGWSAGRADEQLPAADDVHAARHERTADAAQRRRARLSFSIA